LYQPVGNVIVNVLKNIIQFFKLDNSEDVKFLWQLVHDYFRLQLSGDHFGRVLFPQNFENEHLL
jgi:hypothetical protein